METGIILSITVGILSVLVVTLITWQVYTLIDIRKIRKDVNRRSETNRLESERNLATIFMSMSDFYYSRLSGKDQPEQEKMYKYIYNRASCILHASRIKDFETCRVVAKVLIEAIHPENISMSESDKKSLFYLLSSVEHARSIEGFSELLVCLSMIKVRQEKKT